MSCKLYTLDNAYIMINSFTGIVEMPTSKSWYFKGKLHRTDGPAIKWPDGSNFWYINGNRHRINGPAAEWSNGRKCWYFNDKEFTEEQHKLLVDIMKLKGLL